MDLPSYYESFRPYCRTRRQFEMLDAILANNCNMERTSLAMGLNKGGAAKVFRTVRKNAAQQGHAPEYGQTHAVPDTQIIKGVSTYYDEDGNIKGQWVKSNARAESIEESLRAIAESLNDSIRPASPLPLSTHGNDDLLNLHVLTDYHLGMFAWDEVSGDDWSSKKAEAFLTTWFEQSLASAPNAKYGLLLNLGDFFHSDSIAPVTPSSGHLLDVDAKYAQLVRMGTRILRKAIDMMRTKYETILVYNVAGNHDFSSTIWLKEFLHTHYESVPNVIVDNSPDIYHSYIHGDVSLFFHHGHKRSMKNIAEVLVAKFRNEFGATSKSYAHLGHLHHIELKEVPSMVIEQHRTMAAKDTYASNNGYISGRSAFVITYHKQHGEVNRVSTSAELVEALMDTAS